MSKQSLSQARLLNTIVLLLLFAGAQAQEKPAEIPTGWRELIGEYASGGDTLCVFERDALLRIISQSGKQFTLREEQANRFRVIAGSDADGPTCTFERASNGFASSLLLEEKSYERIPYGEGGEKSFRITPLKPLSVLRKEAERAAPPKEQNRPASHDLVDLLRLDSTIRLDVRYATTNNFLGEKFYSQARAFLQRPAAEALVRVHRSLRSRGYGLLIHDAYRPWYVTKMFWDATPESQKQFVADPAKGSRHNRGCAVDLSLYNLTSGHAVAMVSGYDEFSRRAYPDYPGGTSLQRWHRALLSRAMEAEGFRVFAWEWWHYDYKDWQDYPIGTATFEEIR